MTAYLECRAPRNTANHNLLCFRRWMKANGHGLKRLMVSTCECMSKLPSLSPAANRSLAQTSAAPSTAVRIRSAVSTHSQRHMRLGGGPRSARAANHCTARTKWDGWRERKHTASLELATPLGPQYVCIPTETSGDSNLMSQQQQLSDLPRLSRGWRRQQLTRSAMPAAQLRSAIVAI